MEYLQFSDDYDFHLIETGNIAIVSFPLQISFFTSKTLNALSSPEYQVTRVVVLGARNLAPLQNHREFFQRKMTEKPASVRYLLQSFSA